VVASSPVEDRTILITVPITWLDPNGFFCSPQCKAIPNRSTYCALFGLKLKSKKKLIVRPNVCKQFVENAKKETK
jgi:hypothetical protein